MYQTLSRVRKIVEIGRVTEEVRGPGGKEKDDYPIVILFLDFLFILMLLGYIVIS